MSGLQVTRTLAFPYGFNIGNSRFRQRRALDHVRPGARSYLARRRRLLSTVRRSGRLN